MVLLPLAAHGRLFGGPGLRPAPGGNTGADDSTAVLRPADATDETVSSWQKTISRLEACVLLVQRAPRRSFAALFFARLFLHHLRIGVEKRAGLRALKVATKKVSVAIVTTAALPWKTGTAVNALLRAAYLAKAGHPVTLCLPWIHPSEQAAIFGAGRTFDTPAAQEQHMRKWLSARDGQAIDFKITWYPARYDHTRGSILPLGDTTKWIDDDTRDVCVLEEPEHLNWYHTGRSWRRRFKLVVGVVHTNYISYAQLYQPENVGAVRMINNMVCRAYCDRIVKLSDCLQDLPRSSVCNVHGVRAEFVAEGRRRATTRATFDQGAYFIGKVLWAKGHRYLIDYLKDEQPSAARERTRVDIYGTGEDLPEVEAAAEAEDLDLRFCGACDHADASLHGYKVFVNPSRTEVLSTTTAEALAMGKFAVIERNPSNEFFYNFTNVLTYETPEEFREALQTALTSTPAPLPEAESHALSWMGGTERFLASVDEATQLAEAPQLGDGLAHLAHNIISGGKGYFADWVKSKIFESGPISRQRWLHKERRWRQCRSVTDIVDKSVAVSPPNSDGWHARYDGNVKSWTSRLPSFNGKKESSTRGG